MQWVGYIVKAAAPAARASEGRGQVACNCTCHISEPSNEETDELTSTTTMLDQLNNLDRTNFDHIIAMYVAKSSYLNHSMIMIIFTYTKHKKK